MLETLERAAPDAEMKDIKALLGRMMFSGKAMHKKARSPRPVVPSTREAWTLHPVKISKLMLYCIPVVLREPRMLVQPCWWARPCTKRRASDPQPCTRAESQVHCTAETRA